MAALMVAPHPAAAQWFWEHPPGISADEAARSAIRHGFRVLARPVRNEDVYVADVVDRMGAREQLVIAADSGRILQRFYLEGRSVRAAPDPTIPRGPMPPARVPVEREDRQPSLFSRLFGGFGGDDQDTRSASPDRPFVAPEQAPPRTPRTTRHSRITEGEPGTVPPVSPVESAPLAPSGAAPALPSIAPKKPVPSRKPAEASLPPPSVTPPAAVAPTPAPIAPATVTAPAATDRPSRPVSRDPLAIPGSREDDEKKAATAKATLPAPSTPAKPTAAPAATTAPAAAVPVAPLE